jgi:hypothetical protein
MGILLVTLSQFFFEPRRLPTTPKMNVIIEHSFKMPSGVEDAVSIVLLFFGPPLPLILDEDHWFPNEPLCLSS